MEKDKHPVERPTRRVLWPDSSGIKPSTHIVTSTATEKTDLLQTWQWIELSNTIVEILSNWSRGALEQPYASKNHRFICFENTFLIELRASDEADPEICLKRYSISANVLRPNLPQMVCNIDDPYASIACREEGRTIPSDMKCLGRIGSQATELVLSSSKKRHISRLQFSLTKTPQTER